MGKDTKPTAGAVRAARAILSEVDPTACTQFDYENDVQGMARLIDTETAAPDLAAALQALIVADDNCEWDEMREGILLARAALRKAGIE